MQVFWRATTMVRPRCGSPGLPVNGAAMASPTTAVTGSSSAAAQADCASAVPISRPYRHLTKDFIGAAIKPRAREHGLPGTELARRIDRAGAPGPFDLRQQTVVRRID